MQRLYEHIQFYYICSW